MSDVPQIFDPRMRRLRRGRAGAGFDGFAFLAHAAAEELGERLDALRTTGPRAVAFGARAPIAALDWIRGDIDGCLVSAGGLVFEEDRLPFGRETLDLYASVMALHAVNDLPGALAQIRRCLQPQGLFVAAMLGGETLHELRSAFAEAEIEIDGGVSPRVAPFVDVRDAGALLQRAGFAQPVADIDTLTVRYAHPLKLIADLRGMGESNVLSERRRAFLKRALLQRVCEVYGERFGGEDGVPATYQILYLTGRAP